MWPKPGPAATLRPLTVGRHPPAQSRARRGTHAPRLRASGGGESLASPTSVAARLEPGRSAGQRVLVWQWISLSGLISRPWLAGGRHVEEAEHIRDYGAVERAHERAIAPGQCLVTAERVGRVDAGRDDAHVAQARGADETAPRRLRQIALVDALGQMLLPRHALALGPAVQGDLARDDVGVEEAAGAKDARHLREDRRRIAEVLEQPAGEHDIERTPRERKRAGVAEERVALGVRATVVLAHRANGVRGVVEREEPVRSLPSEPDEQSARACADLDGVPSERKQSAHVRDLRFVDEVEDVAPRRIEELAVADRSIPCGGVALAIARLMLVIVSFVQRRRRDVRFAATSCCTRWRDSPKTSPASRRLRRSSPVSLVAASVAEVCALACWWSARLRAAAACRTEARSLGGRRTSSTR